MQPGLTRRLGRGGLAVRAVIGAALVVALVHGALGGTDDWWPFGPMSQYALTVSDSDRIVSTYIEADNTAGHRVRVPLTSRGCGIARAEIEGELPEIVADPSHLQVLADSCERMHPSWPRYVRLYLMQDTTLLTDTDEPAGTPTTDTLAVWTVR